MKIRDSGMPAEDYWESFFNVDFILSELQLNQKIKDAVEFGSGYGTFTVPASKIIKGTIFAFDIDDTVIEILNQKIKKENIKNIKVLKGDFEQDGTGLENESIDYVMLFNILHTEEPLKLLKEAYRILKPRGKAGVIHWIHSSETPRGPLLEIRPKEEQCVNWLIETGFEILVKPVLLPPYHYGLVGIKK